MAVQCSFQPGGATLLSASVRLTPLVVRAVSQPARLSPSAAPRAPAAPIAPMAPAAEHAPWGTELAPSERTPAEVPTDVRAPVAGRHANIAPVAPAEIRPSEEEPELNV